MNFYKSKIVVLSIAFSLIVEFIAIAQKINLADDCWRSNLESIVAASYPVASIDYDVDGLVDLDQLASLVSIKVGDLCSAKSLQSALFYLQISEKFKSICLDIALEKDGFHLKFLLKKQEIVNRIVVSGFLRDKDKIKYAYLLEPGDIFHEEKHKAGIDHVLKSLKDAGHLHAQVKPVVNIDPDTHFVTIFLQIEKGPHFKIEGCSIEFSKINDVDEIELLKLQKNLRFYFVNKVIHKFFISKNIQALTVKMQKYLQSKGFVDASVQVEPVIDYPKKAITLKLSISLERKRMILFLGNHFFSNKEILNHIMSYGALIWNFPSALIADEIEQLYKNKGFFNVKVQTTMQDHAVVCLIEEGIRFRFSDINIDSDVDLITPAALKKMIRFYFKNRFIDIVAIKKFADIVLAEYKRAGYWDAQVEPLEFKSTVKQSCNVIVPIKAQVRRFVKTCSVAGLQDIDYDFAKFVKKYENLPFNIDFFKEQKQWITRFLKAQGYQKFVIDYQIIEDEVVGSLTQKVDLVWKILLQDQAIYFGKTIFIGNAFVPEKFLKHQMVHTADQVLRVDLLEKSLQKLKELDVFKSVQIFPANVLDPDGRKPIFVKLVQDDTYEIKARFGLQQVGRNLQPLKGFTYKAGASFKINNLAHRADQTIFDADVTKFYRNISASYMTPWIFQKSINAECKLFDASYNQPVYIGTQDGLYRATQQGFLFNISAPALGKKYQCTFNGTAGIEFLGLFQADQPDLGAIIDYQPQFLEKRIGYLQASVKSLIEAVDNGINPTSGFVTFATVKGMFDLNNQASFVKILLEHTHYLRCSFALVFACKLRMGHVFACPYNRINPIERFYLGGACSVRGYQRDYCPPLGLLTKPIYDQHAGLPACSGDLWRYAPQGGRSMFSLNLDARFNLYKSFGIVIFSDFGVLVKDSFADVKNRLLETCFAGSGIGFRHDTPIGPLRFDVGWKWRMTHPDFQSRSVWYLTLGQAF